MTALLAVIGAAIALLLGIGLGVVIVAYGLLPLYAAAVRLAGGIR
jgi:hypothetical protein